MKPSKRSPARRAVSGSPNQQGNITRRSMNVYTPTLLRLMSDGAPHTFAEILLTLSPLISPHQALAAHNNKRPRKVGAKTTTVDDAIEIGKRTIVLRAIGGLVQTGRAVSDVPVGPGQRPRVALDRRYTLTAAGLAAANCPVAWQPPDVSSLYHGVLFAALHVLRDLRDRLAAGGYFAGWPDGPPTVGDIDRLLQDLRSPTGNPLPAISQAGRTRQRVLPTTVESATGDDDE